MSELYGGGGGGGGAGAASRNGGARGVSGPVPVPHAPTSGMRTPTDIMRERNARMAAREQRKQEEAEHAEAERQKRFRDEELRKSAERRALAAGVGERPAAQPDYAVASPPPVPPPPASGNPQAPADPSSQVPSSSQRQSYRGMHGQSASQDESRAIPQNRLGSRSSNQASTRPADPSTNPATATPTAAAAAAAAQRSTQSSFPHAFERWETLSSHWEGLTSYWIRRMEQNNEEIRRDPIAQQMSRQITDLSAAGANLFHAVVELQRLRASSERKFQRWFFKTQEEQEGNRDAQSKLQAALEAERAGRKEDARSRQQDDRARQLSMDAERRMNEMKRELQISKDEARRAWEELGRREQLERDRIYSLTEGHGIVIGNIQVMPQGLMSRGASLQRSTRDAGQAYAAPATSSRGAQDAPSPTETDPFSRGGPAEAYTQPTTQTQSSRAGTGQRYPEDETARYAAGAPPASTTPASVGLAALAGSPEPANSPSPARPHEDMYMQPNVYLDPTHASQQQRPPTAGVVSEEESDDGGYALDDQGNILRDERGNAIPFRNLAKAQVRPGQAPATSSSARAAGSGQGGSRQETGDLERERIRAAAYGRSDSTRQVPTAGRGGGDQQQDLPPANYEGQGWGSDDDDDLSPNPTHEERQMQQDLRAHQELEDRRILEEERQAMRHEDDEGDWDSSAGGAVVQRHHHPTRLSDVLEEDETSRASRQSRDSQGYNF